MYHSYKWQYWKILTQKNNNNFILIVFLTLYSSQSNMKIVLIRLQTTDKQKYTIFCHIFHLLKGSSTPIRHLSLKALLPNTEQYMTYEGSTTHPGCWESAVWIIYNKPIYITKQEVRHFSYNKM